MIRGGQGRIEQPSRGVGTAKPVVCLSFCCGIEQAKVGNKPMAHLSTVSNQARVRVLAADSNSMSTQLLAEALGRDNQFQMIESPSNAPAVLTLVNREKPHVLVLCGRIGQTNGGTGELLREIRRQSPATRVIVLLDAPERGSVVEAFHAGALGVFCRTESFRLLGKCIQCVQQGRVWASAAELQYLVEASSQPALKIFQTSDGSLLSARERDVVRCLAEGLSNREIAQRLKLTEHTVKNYLFRIFDKLGVSSRVEVVLYALGSAASRNSDPSGGRKQEALEAVRPRLIPAGPVVMRKNII
jgi:DNA-binding NarL/FixJ family response regulator